MAKLTKRMREIAEKVDADKVYGIEEAVGLLNELSKTKFKESFDVSINLGVDPRKSDQVVRGATTLPHGTGKSVRVLPYLLKAIMPIKRQLLAPTSLVLRTLASRSRAATWTSTLLSQHQTPCVLSASSERS